MLVKLKAEDYFERISDGHANPTARPSDPSTDRELRKMVEIANQNGDCIINSGNGYYRPVPGDGVDTVELNLYLAKELKRARAIQLKRLSMKEAFKGWEERAIFIEDKREVE